MYDTKVGFCGLCGDFKDVVVKKKGVDPRLVGKCPHCVQYLKSKNKTSREE